VPRRATCSGGAHRGIQAAKRCADLIRCATAAADHVAVEFSLDEAAKRCTAGAGRNAGGTGVEMEALAAVQIGLLTVYDMCKGSTAAWSSATCACSKSTAVSREIGPRFELIAQRKSRHANCCCGALH